MGRERATGLLIRWSAVRICHGLPINQSLITIDNRRFCTVLPYCYSRDRGVRLSRGRNGQGIGRPPTLNMEEAQPS